MNKSDFIFWFFFFLLVDVRIHADGEPVVISLAQTVFARPGDVVVLPFLLRPQLDVRADTVEWSKQDGRGGVDYIHIYRRGEQLVPGATRTNLFVDQLEQGNVSLAILNVTSADSGTYRCAVPRLDGHGATVELVVDPDSVHTPSTAPSSTARAHILTDPPTWTNTAGPGLGQTVKFPMAAVAVAVFIMVIMALPVIAITRGQKQKDGCTEPCSGCWSAVQEETLRPPLHGTALLNCSGDHTVSDVKEKQPDRAVLCSPLMT